MKSYDFVVVGAGIVGLSIALELRKQNSKASILIIDKESEAGFHASGRNSGVIHAGFYYTANTLKARLTRDGNLRLHQFCEEHQLKLRRCGKLVVATRPNDVEVLEVLYQRAIVNQVPLIYVDKKQALEIEPRVNMFGDRALFSPSTSSANPKQVLSKFIELARLANIEINFETSFRGLEGNNCLKTSKNRIQFGFLVNCAGLQADQIAHAFDCGTEYRIMPYRGLYLYGNLKMEKFNTNIYPVPDMRQPFLGVHITVTEDGHTKLGPTAIPAFWREQYGGMSRFNLSELMDIGWRNLALLLNNSGDVYRALAREEFKNLFKSHVVKKAKLLATGIEKEDFKVWGKVGIRAQLIHKRDLKLVNDFILEKGVNSLHVLNAVSPGWTCSLPFAELVVEKIMTSQPIQSYEESNVPCDL